MGELNQTDDGVIIRSAEPTHASEIHALVQRCGTLELNSGYAYLLLADHFRSTSVVAMYQGRVVGAVVGYRPPTRPNAIFVWQVGVDPAMRGRRLGVRLLDAFSRTAGAASATHLEATVAPSNSASRALFLSFARSRGCELREEPYYPASLFPDAHEPEPLIRIGPLQVAS